MKFGRITIIVLATVLLTTLGVGAADTWRGASGTLLGQLIGSKQAPRCPSGMVEIATARTFSCVDEYEASPAQTCTIHELTSAEGTISNVADSDCKAVAEPEVKPWRFITREQAMTMCAKSGKRLPNAAEWYEASIGTRADHCNVRSGNVKDTGFDDACKAASGIKDAIGNVWEWVSDDVINGQYNGRALPESGYVVQVDNGGVATVTSQNSASSSDGYLWSDASGSFGMMRGGFYSSQSDAGMYTIQAATAPTFSGAAIGFRCVR